MCIRDRSKSVDVNTVREWKETRLRELTSQFDPKDVFNADETGLFFNLLHDRTMAFKEDSCHGGDVYKRQILIWATHVNLM